MDNSIWANDNSGSSLKLYLQEISQFPLLTPEEEIALGHRIKKGDKEAIEKMVVSNLRLVVKIARKYMGIGIPLIDLIQEGTLGLQFAAERFDVDLGFRFSTYAGYWIRQQITKAITDDSRVIHIPANVINELLQLNDAKQKFANENGRKPTFEELADMTNMSQEKLRDVLDAQRAPVSLDKIIPDGDNDVSLMDFIPDINRITPEEYSRNSSRRDAILNVLNSLEPREKDILIKRFGLDDGVQKSLEQVGELVGLTRERVRQLELGALNKLRNPVRANALLEYK